MNNVSKLLLAASVPLFGLAACGGGSDIGQAIGTARPQVRLANVSPAAPSVTLQRESQSYSEASNISYPTITNYFDVDTGGANWTVRATGSGNVVGTQNFDAQRGHRYTLLAVADSATATSVAWINDPITYSLTDDGSRVRVFNASYNAKNIDVYLIGQNQNINSETPDSKLSNIAFKQTGPANGTESLLRQASPDIAPYKVVVTTAGTKNVLFQGSYVVKNRQDILFVTVPKDVNNPNAGINLLAKQGDEAAKQVPSL